MEENHIPKNLLEKYNVYKEDDLKYSCLKIKDFENEYINKENSMLDSLTSLKKTLELILEKLADIILNNKNTFNDACLENGVKSLDYLILLKINIYFITQIISKLENKEIEIETFNSICDKLKPQYSKLFEAQYPPNDPSQVTNIENYVKEVLDYITKIKDSTNKPGIMLTTFVKFKDLDLNKNVFNSIDKFNEIKVFKDTAFFNNQTKANEMILFDLLIIIKGIKNISEFIYFSYILDENDLDNNCEKSEEWDTLKKLIWTVKPKKDIDLEKITTELMNKQRMRMAQMRKMGEGGMKFGTMVGNMINNMFSSFQAEYEFKKDMIKLFQMNMMMEQPNRMMKMKPMIKKMVSTRLPSIECRKKLYVRREFKPITLDYIKELNDFLNGKITEPSDKNILLDNYTLPENIANKKLFSSKLEKNEKDDYISTRILNNSTLLFKGEKLEERSGFFGFGAKKEENVEHKNEFKNTLIIHIYGGSYKLNMNLMNERYLREWSKDSGVAIMTIKKPEKEYKFPTVLNELYQVYMWLLNHAKTELNMDIQKIIISGDSFGGYFCYAFTNLLIGINLFENRNIKIPDLILLEYPNFTFDLNKSGVAMCMGAIFFISHSAFRAFVDDYLGGFKDYQNMFVSPLYTSDKVIEKLPKVRFFFGNQDGYRDEFLRGMYRLRNCKDIIGYNFLNLGHGFNGLENKDIFEMAKDFIVEEVKAII